MRGNEQKIHALCAYSHRSTNMSLSRFLVSSLPVLLLPGSWPTKCLPLLTRVSISDVRPLFCLHLKLMTKCTSQGSALEENDPSPLSCRPFLSDAIRSFTVHTNILCQHIHEPFPSSFFLCYLIQRKYPYHEQMVWIGGRYPCNRWVDLGILAICPHNSGPSYTWSWIYLY